MEKEVKEAEIEYLNELKSTGSNKRNEANYKSASKIENPTNDNPQQSNNGSTSEQNLSQRVKIFVKNNWIIILGILYILSPLDFIPEVILGPLGIVDDFAVMLAVLVARWRG